MKKGYKKFDTEYLIFYEKFVLYRWHRYFRMLKATNDELQGIREELHERSNNTD